MNNKLTLTQYIESKRQLAEAIKNDPIVDHIYMVSKYCKLPIGLSEDSKEYVSLKPKMELAITWHYSYDGKHEHLHEMQRKPVKVIVVDKETKQQYDLFQTDERLTKWIQTNTRIITG